VERSAALVGIGTVVEQPGNGRRLFVLRRVHKRLVQNVLRDISGWETVKPSDVRWVRAMQVGLWEQAMASV
jgi:hypothetical protein